MPEEKKKKSAPKPLKQTKSKLAGGFFNPTGKSADATKSSDAGAKPSFQPPSRTEKTAKVVELSSSESDSDPDSDDEAWQSGNAVKEVTEAGDEVDASEAMAKRMFASGKFINKERDEKMEAVRAKEASKQAAFELEKDLHAVLDPCTAKTNEGYAKQRERRMEQQHDELDQKKLILEKQKRERGMYHGCGRPGTQDNDHDFGLL